MKKANASTWLPHLNNSIPKEAYGYPISMYSIALEGWRRGLQLKFINNNRQNSVIRYSLQHKNKEHYFMGSMGDLVSKEAIKICRNKHLTKDYLAKGNVPIPEGQFFGKEYNDMDIINYAMENLKFPLVVKPYDGMGGRGVIANIKNKKELQDALVYVRNELNHEEVIVEKFVNGTDYRIYVVDNQVIGAIKRIPANVIGDGTSTIKQLINMKNRFRNSNPALSRRRIRESRELHDMLRHQNHSLESIPKKDEQVLLSSKSNISAGGDPVDVTDQLTDEIKDIAIKAAKAIPDLPQCGVDVMVDIKENTGVVLEVNSIPSIRTHLFPMKGKARDIPKAIIDYYFPETKTNRKNPYYYFDIQPVFDSFQNRLAQEILIPPAPSGDLAATRFIVSGRIIGVKYERWIKKQAKTLKLNGYVRLLRNGNISVIVSGDVTALCKFKEIIKEKAPQGAVIDGIVEKSRKSPVKVGFQIKDKPRSSNSLTLSTLSGNQRKTQRKTTKAPLNNIKQERDFYKKKYLDIKESTSWKITKPIRKMARVKKIFRKTVNADNK